MRAVASDPLLKDGQLAVTVARLDEGGPVILLSHQARLPLMPASNMKLVTTSAFLDRFGPEFRFRTALAARGRTLALVGDGDPTFGDAELLKPMGWRSVSVFETWIELLRGDGARSFDRVVVDDSLFDTQWYHPNWSPDYHTAQYAAQVGGLNFNVNCVDFYVAPRGKGAKVGFSTDPPTDYVTVRNSCVGGRNAVALDRAQGGNVVTLSGEAEGANADPLPVSIHDPGLFTGTVFAEMLRRAGVSVREVAREGGVRDELAARRPAWRVLAVHETPIATVLWRANKDSMNLYCEAMLKRLGAVHSGQPGSWSNGADAVGRFLTRRVGIAPDQFVIDDGSGLSRGNRVTTELLARVLAHDYYGPGRAPFVDSLAVGGRDGTLRNRFKDTPLVGRVHAKSGYIRGVSALSGYVRGSSGTWYSFSILMNGVPNGKNSVARQLQERIVAAIDAHDAAGR